MQYPFISTFKTALFVALLAWGLSIPGLKAEDTTPLHAAAEEGRIDVVRELLEVDPASLSKTDKAGNRPLHVAAWNGQATVVTILLDKGADINAKGFDEWTALHFAASKGHASTCQLLLERGADREALNGIGRTPLRMATGSAKRVIEQYRESFPGADGFIATASLGAEEEVRLWLEKYPELIRATDRADRTALEGAAAAGHVSVMRFLLEKGASPQARKDSKTNSPLVAATLSGYVEAVDLLLEAGAEVDGTSNGTAPLTEAVRMVDGVSNSMMVDVMNMMAERPVAGKTTDEISGDVTAVMEKANVSNMGALLSAVRRSMAEQPPILCSRKREVAMRLLAAGADPNATSSTVAPLLAATLSGDAELVKLLLEAGADPDKIGEVPDSFSGFPSNPYASTALTSALIVENLGVLERLLEAGADPLIAKGAALTMAADLDQSAALELLLSKVDPAEASPAEHFTVLVALRACPEMLKKALESGFDPKARDEMQITALHRAAWGNKAEATRLLLEAGADPNAGDHAFYTPLHNAAEYGAVEVIELLLDRGAKLEAKTKQKRTPLTLAANKGYQETVELLLKAGASARVVDSEGFSVLIGAARNGLPDIAKVLLEAGARVDGFYIRRVEVSPMTLLADSGGMTKVPDMVYSVLSMVAMGPKAFKRAVAEVKSEAGFGADSTVNVGSVEDFLETARLLIDSGAAVNPRRDGAVLTPLHSAMENGFIEMIELLVEKGADIEGVGSGMQGSPLHLASRRNETAAARKLLELGADVNVRDSMGGTPLLLAVKENKPEMVRLLLEAGADASIPAKSGITAMDMATYFKNGKIIALLLEYKK